MTTTWQAAQIFRREQSLSVEHVGLAYAKLMPPTQAGPESAKLVRERLAPARQPAIYPAAFRRWRVRTPPLPAGRRVLRFLADSPVLCGLGEPTPLENGLSLHHTYGTPVLPGSSLKGVTRAWMTARYKDDPDWGPDSPGFGALFGRGGDGGEGAAVDFLDAWMEPAERPFTAEILTPHYASYYQGEQSPDGQDAPIPVTFLGVAAGTRFRVVLEGDEDWLSIAEEALTRALEELGVGAKTRAGYGRLTSLPMDAADQEALLPSARPDVQLHILSHSSSVANVAGNLKAWLSGKDTQDARYREHLQDNESTRLAIADWLEKEEVLSRWRRGSRTERALYKSLRALREEAAPAPAAPAPAAPAPAAPVPSFGDKALTDADTAPLPKNKKKHGKERQKRIERIAAGGYSEEAVQAFLAFLEAAGAPAGAINQVRRAYGLPEVS